MPAEAASDDSMLARDGAPFADEGVVRASDSDRQDEVRGDRIQRDEADGRLLALGPYRVLSTLGKGGMGVVYEVEDTRLSRIVALKVVNQAEDAHDEDIQRFHHEASAVARLKHPNIVPIHDVGRIGNLHYFTMDCINGETLSDWIRLEEPTIKERVMVVAQVADALQHAHDHGIIHRDLKPSNILIDRHQTPFLTDFGLARDDTRESRLTVSGLAVGTPEYMAPEQASGQRHGLGPRTDLWGLGALLYEICTGQVPFPGKHTYEILDNIIRKEAEPPQRINAAIDDGLQRIILTCLAKQPKHRYSNARSLAEDLRAWVRGGSVAARAPGWEQAIRRMLHRHPLLSTGLIVAVAMTAFLVVGLQHLHRQKQIRIEGFGQSGYAALNRAAEVQGQPRVDALIRAQTLFALGLGIAPEDDACGKGIRSVDALLAQEAERVGRWDDAARHLEDARDHGLPIGDYLRRLQGLQARQHQQDRWPGRRTRQLLDNAVEVSGERIPLHRSLAELVSLDPVSVRPLLVDVLVDDAEPEQCRLALAALEWIGDAEHAARLVEELDDEAMAAADLLVPYVRVVLKYGLDRPACRAFLARCRDDTRLPPALRARIPLQAVADGD